MNYQEKVATRADVRALYEKVINNPAIKTYRGYTDSKSYAWDAVAGECIKRDGVVWFENPSYAEPLIAEEELLPEEELACDGELSTFADSEAESEESTEEFARVTELENEIRALVAERDEAREALLALRDVLALIANFAAAK